MKEKDCTDMLLFEYLHNNEAAEMLTDFIMKNRVYDPAYHFYTEYFNDMVEMIENGENNITPWNTRKAPRLS